MALTKNNRSRVTNGNTSRVRDARDLIRAKSGNNSTRGPTAVSSKRILKTAHGLVTNKRVKAISTSLLKNRQSLMQAPLRRESHSIPKPGVGATIGRSAVIRSNPLLQSAIMDIAGALAHQKRQAAHAPKRLQTKPDRLTVRDSNYIGHDSIERVSAGLAARPGYRVARSSLVSSLSRSLADIPRASARPFAPERPSLSDRMRGRLDQRHDPPSSVIVSNLHPNVSESDISELFRTIGPIVTSMFLSPGTALVSYHRKNDAIKAVETYHLRLLDGQPMTCVLLSPDMVPDKHQPSIPTSGSGAAPHHMHTVPSHGGSHSVRR